MKQVAHGNPHIHPFPMVFATLAALALSGVALAAPPTPQTCDDADSGTRIKCRFGNIVEQQKKTAEMIDLGANFPESQKEALRKQVERTSRARNRTSAEDYKQITKKPRPVCQVLEIDGDGVGDDDGVCKGNEDCVEVAGDQIGNDDGICRPLNGRNREACVEICDDEAINSDPDNFDDDPTQESLGADVEEHLDELTDQYVELNEMLEQDMQLRSAARVMSANGDPCAVVIAARQNANLVAFTVGFADGARMGADIAEAFCRQDAAGFNSSVACSVSEGIAGVARIIAGAMQFGDADISSNTLDASYACLQSLNTAVGESNSDLDAIQSQLNTLQQMVDSLQRELGEVKLLVTTPLGRREGFPN